MHGYQSQKVSELLTHHFLAMRPANKLFPTLGFSFPIYKVGMNNCTYLVGLV